MTTWDKDLTGIHKSVAADAAKIVHVLAGPGTGKTFAMIRRVARLLEEGAVPEQILAISFTRTAARDLREQLTKLGTPGAENVRASTLHSFCFSILGTQQAFAFTKRSPRPLLSFEIDCLEADLASLFQGKRKIRKLLAAYEAAWARLQHEQAGHAKSAIDQGFENKLLSWLRFYEAMLIGELVPLTLDFLKSNPALASAPPLSHVLVDEYQDLNKSDQSLIKLLARPASLLVIGDDNQSLYSFRYANPEGIRSFPTEVAGTKSYTIEECRRCPPNIVAISNALIAHDPHTSRPTPLKPDLAKAAAKIWIVQHQTLSDEVESTAAFADHYLNAHPEVAPGRVLVLAPRRFIGNGIKDALIARGRNALSYFQEDALSSASASEGFCLLTLLVNNSDRAALRAWLGFGSADTKSKPVARLRTYCEANGIDVFEALIALADGSLKLPHTKSLISRWEDLQLRLGELAGLSGLQLVDALWPAIAPDVSDIRLLAARIAYDTPDSVDLLDELRVAVTQPELPGSDSDIIQVMSLHKSKGLTRDLVIVAGCMAGTLPFVDEDEPAEVQTAKIEEQRRLFYVAITRATQVLVISAAVRLPLSDALRGGATVSKKMFIGGIPYAITSFTPFIGELGETAPTPISTATWKQQAGFV
jgi:DNA helicase II / ATP-dependent DNA helicase PcrA